MVNKTNKNYAEKTNKKTVKNISSQHLSQEPTYTPKNLNNDDLIKSLANAHENKRARQVIEWERDQRNSWTLFA